MNDPIFLAVLDCAVLIDTICSYDVDVVDDAVVVVLLSKLLLLESLLLYCNMLYSIIVIPIQKSDHAPATPRKKPQTKHSTIPSVVGINVVPMNDRQANTNTGHNNLSCRSLLLPPTPALLLSLILCNISELNHANTGRKLYGKNDMAPYAGRYSAGIVTRVFTMDNSAILDT